MHFRIGLLCIASWLTAIAGVCDSTRGDTFTTTSTAMIGTDTEGPNSETAPASGSLAFSSAEVGGGGRPASTPEAFASALGFGTLAGDFALSGTVGERDLPPTVVANAGTGTDASAMTNVVFTLDVVGPGILSSLVENMTLQVLDTGYPEKAQIDYGIFVNDDRQYGFTATLEDNGSPVLTDQVGSGPFPNFTGSNGLFTSGDLTVELAIGPGPATIDIKAKTSANAVTGNNGTEQLVEARIGDPPFFNPNNPGFDANGASVQFQATAVPEPSSILAWAVLIFCGLISLGHRRIRGLGA